MKLTAPAHKPGDEIDNLIYVGFIKDYHLLCNTEDESNAMTWDEVNKSDLPNREELSLMYANKEFIGGFKDGWYWSSTEYDYFGSWSQRFSDGTQTVYSKYTANYVRCVKRVKVFDESILKELEALKARIKEIEGKL